jgi:hypothetical protein
MSLHPTSDQIPSSVILSQTPSVYISPLNIIDQVSHPYETTGKITVLYITEFIFSSNNKTLQQNSSGRDYNPYSNYEHTGSFYKHPTRYNNNNS